MMCSLATIALLTFVTNVNAEDAMDQLANQLIDKFINRARGWDAQPADLDGTTLGKPGSTMISNPGQLAVSGHSAFAPRSLPYGPHLASRNFALPLPGNHPHLLAQAVKQPKRQQQFESQPRVRVYEFPDLPVTNQVQGQANELSSEEAPPVESKPLEARVVEAMSLVMSAKGVAIAALRNGIDQRAKVMCAMALAAILVVTPTYSNIISASQHLTDVAYPIIESLNLGSEAENVGPLSSKAIGVALTANPKDVIKAIDAGVDAFMTVPPEKFKQVVKAIRAATSEAKASSSRLNLDSMPSLEASKQVATAAAAALALADKVKVKAFADEAIKAFNSVNKLAAALVLIDGGKFSDDINQAEQNKVSKAALEVASSG
jgi:DNA-binding NarL/FixJ family response regulator